MNVAEIKCVNCDYVQMEQQQFKADFMARLTEMELKYKQNVPGAAV